MYSSCVDLLGCNRSRSFHTKNEKHVATASSHYQRARFVNHSIRIIRNMRNLDKLGKKIIIHFGMMHAIPKGDAACVFFASHCNRISGNMTNDLEPHHHSYLFDSLHIHLSMTFSQFLDVTPKSPHYPFIFITNIMLIRYSAL